MMPRNLKRIAVTLLLAGVTALAATAQPQKNPESRKVVRKANYALAERFSQKRISQMVYSTRIRPNWFKESDRFWYKWKAADGEHWFIVDPARGSKTEVFDRDELAARLTEVTRDPYDAQHLPRLSGFELVDDARFEFEVDSKTPKPDSLGKPTSETITYRFSYDIASKELTWSTETKKERYPEWANVSPDGARGVYVKGYNLFLMDSTSLRKAAQDEKDSTLVERQLTFDGTAEHSWDGDNYTGDMEKDSTARHMPMLVWSPDSRHFAIVRWDMEKIEKLWVIHATAEPRPTLQSYHYQMPGDPGPQGTLHVFDVEDGSSREVACQAFKDQDLSLMMAEQTAADAYNEFFGLKWLGDEKGFYLTRLSRDLHRLDLCYVGVGADSTKTLVSERMNTYLEWRQPKLLKNGDFVWWSERSGWANLYLYGADGTLKRNLTEGPFHVEEILGATDRYVVYSASGAVAGENPYQMHNFRVALGGGEPVQLDMADMDVLAMASDDAKYLVANASRVDAKPFVVLIDVAAGKQKMQLEEADFSRLFAAGYRFPERFTVKAADGVTDLYGAIYKPFDFDSTKVYPVCDYVYPGPQVEAVNISWSAGMTRTDRLAQLGFIVVTVGNRGGHPMRSKWYHNYGYGNLRDYGLEDQKYALQQLGERYPWMDLSRVGIHGHSGGGFMSTAAILTYPDFFKAAVSCAGNHDNNIYNRWWSEQHHGVREILTETDTTFNIYVKTNQELAPQLKGHLLLVTGDVDDNVHPANTLRVVDALIRANKRFDMLVLPGQRHGFGSMNEYFFWKMADHYTRFLMGDNTPRPIDIPELNND